MQKQNRIYLSPPHMGGREKEYIDQAFESNWIAPLGHNVDLFERKIEEYLDCRYALAVSSGTAALHLAIKYLGTGSGDFVFCSDFTFAASCNGILYEKAVPVFIDSDEDTWNMSPVALKKALQDSAAKNQLPKAVIVVDLYGIPANYQELLPICREYGVPVIEDAAEALGSSYYGTMCGSLGDIGVISFNANKIITCSGGGMVTTNREGIREKLKFWATQAREPVAYYEHKEIGYNYRLSNIMAGIGCGQMEMLDKYVQRRREINQFYRTALADCPVSFAPVTDGIQDNCWLTVMLIDKGVTVTPDIIINSLERYNVEARHLWKPMHMQPLYKEAQFYSSSNDQSVGGDFFSRGVCLPSGSALTPEELTFICSIIRSLFEKESFGG